MWSAIKAVNHIKANVCVGLGKSILYFLIEVYAGISVNK